MERDDLHERVIRNFRRLAGNGDESLRELAAARGLDYHQLRMAARGRRRACKTFTILLLAEAADVDPVELCQPI